MRINRNCFAALALLLAALMYTGCGDAGGGSGGDISSGISDPTQEYNIKLAINIENGEFTVIPGSSMAKAGEEVTITAMPKEKYELDGEPVVRNINNFRIDGLVPGAEYNTWTFAMPASDVTVSGTFAYFSEAIENAANTVTKNSSWEEINRVASMINKAYEKNVRAVADFTHQDEEIIEEVIEKLIPIIEEKIDDDDITKWTVSSQLASKKMEKFEKKTCLYFVREDLPGNNADRAPEVTVPLSSGWKASEKSPVAVTSEDAEGRAGITCYHLEFPIGNESLKFPRYEVWLVPVAQYEVVYEPAAADAKIVFQDCSSPPPADKDMLTTAKEYTKNTKEITKGVIFIGFVGKDSWHTRIYVGEISTPHFDSEYIIRVIEADSKNHVEATLYDQPVKDGPVFSGAEATDGFNGLPAAWFVPTSQRYTIIVTVKPK